MNTPTLWISLLLLLAFLPGGMSAAPGDISAVIVNERVGLVLTLIERWSGDKIAASAEVKAMTLPGRVTIQKKEKDEARRILGDALRTRAGIEIVRVPDGSLAARRIANSEPDQGSQPMPSPPLGSPVSDSGISPQVGEWTGSTHDSAKAVIFAGTKYYLRSRQHDQFVLTPSGQEDPERWADMITLAYDPKITDGKGLAEKAIACWQSNRDAKATIWQINYVPRLDQMPARSDALYVIATTLARPNHNYDEFAYTTIRLVAGVATTARYSHREYRVGISSAELNAVWLRKNGSLSEDWFVWDGAAEFARNVTLGTEEERVTQ